MSDSERYTIDEARIVSEIIDGEAVIVNLANGYYYSLDAPAAEIWGLHVRDERVDGLFRLDGASVLRRAPGGLGAIGFVGYLQVALECDGVGALARRALLRHRWRRRAERDARSRERELDGAGLP